jgi:hypothetical protein
MKKKYMIAGKIEGKGSFGIIYSYPRLPFKNKYNFYGNTNIISNNKETIENLLNNNEVSKIFYYRNNNNKLNKDYLDEKKNYENILKWNIPNIYFNIPLNYGTINQELINANPNIYNLNWCQGNRSYKYSKNQITFHIGKKINLDNLVIFYKKFDNLIKCIIFLNTNNIIYDDLKIDNILDVDDIYKLSDFSSLKKIDELDKRNFHKLLFYSSYYFIYSPCLNKLLKYYIYKKTNPHIVFDNIFQELKDDLTYPNSNIYINYFYNMIDNIIKFIKKYEEHKKFLLNITLKYKLKKKIKKNNDLSINNFNDNNTNKSKTLILNIKNILIELHNSKFNENNNKVFCEMIIEKYNKNNNNIIIKNLSDKMNIYSLGIIILTKVNFDISDKNKININIFIKLLQLSILCCLNYIVINNYIYLFEPNIENILECYNKLSI